VNGRVRKIGEQGQEGGWRDGGEKIRQKTFFE
jgi:hypothetical protein